MMRRLAALIFLLLAAPLSAQDLPQWQSATVNDLADLLTPQDAVALDKALIQLRDQSGVQGTVVTLPDRARYGGGDGLEPFATRLFNHWGVGNAQRDDGFMLLVLPGDREARIELGAGYPNDADILAQDILRGTLLPAMRTGNPTTGIRQAMQDVIRLIAQPHANGRPAARDRGGDGWVGLVVFGAFGAILLGIARKAWRRRRCPQCGKSGVLMQHRPLHDPLPEGGHVVAREDITRRCPHCSWSETRQRPLGQRSYYGAAGELLRRDTNPDSRNHRGGSGGGFGGGSSRGGGASGRW